MTQLVRGRQNELMFDSTDPKRAEPFVVQVEARSVIILEIGGATPGVLAEVEHSVGNPVLGIWQKFVVSGVAAELSGENTKLLLDVPGTYRVSVDTATSPRVVMSAEKRAQDEVYRMAVNGVPAAAVAAVADCEPIPPLGLISNWG